MKSFKSIFNFTLLAALMTGCATQQTTHERGWIGGTFASVSPPKSIFIRSDAGRVIPGFPPELQPEFSGGVLLTDIYPNTPLSQAGLQEGDLILRLNQQPVTMIKTLQQEVDSSEPGSKLDFIIYRNGETSARSVITGRESYRNNRYITFGIGLKSTFHIDLLPNPDFSLIALGFQRNKERIELHDPVNTFQQRLQNSSKDRTGSRQGITSSEGWETWLAILSTGWNTEIISQEVVDTKLSAN